MTDESKDRLFSVLRWLGVAVLMSLFVGLVYWIFYASLNAEAFPDWTGFNTRDATDDTYPARTLWDWLSLLLVPVVLAVGGLLFTWSENRQTRVIERERVAENQRIERERAQDAVLESYLDQMTDLLLNHDLRESNEGDEVRSVARARTLTALRRVDGERKATIVQFLYEAQLIGYPNDAEVVDSVVQMRQANLVGAKLLGANLVGAKLLEANLVGADLFGADLEWADLEWASLDGANLEWADLLSANLKRASLLMANLGGANLGGANLEGANLKRANLRGAEGLTLAQLRQAKSFHGATLPDYINPADLGDKWSPPKPKNTPEPKP